VPGPGESREALLTLWRGRLDAGEHSIPVPRTLSSDLRLDDRASELVFSHGRPPADG
jgi:hypothetical protein